MPAVLVTKHVVAVAAQVLARAVIAGEDVIPE